MSFQPEKKLMSAKDFYESSKSKFGKDIGELILQKLKKRLERENPKSIETHYSGRFCEVVENEIEEYFENHKEKYKEMKAGLYFDAKVKVFKSSNEEARTGSDLAFFFELLDFDGTPIESKALLIQAKSGVIKSDGPPVKINVSNSDLNEQLKKINSITPDDGYLLVYTSKGAFCMKAADVIKEMGKVSLTSESMLSIDKMIESIFNCTAGNRDKISPKILGVSRNKNGLIDISEAAHKISSYKVDEAVSLSLKPIINK